MVQPTLRNVTTHILLMLTLTVGFAACGGGAGGGGSAAAPPVAVKPMPPIPDLAGVRTFTTPIPELPADRRGITPAALTKLGALEHPRAAWDAGLQGWAVYDFVVDPNGRVNPKYVRLVRASNDVFAKPAENAVRAATFTPAMQAGTPVASLVRLPVYFSLEQAAGRK